MYKNRNNYGGIILSEKKTVKYDDSSVKHVKNGEAIRLRPTMYIGSIGTAGVQHLLREVLDNSLDEFEGGFGKEIIVSVSELGNYLEVIDYGRGIPHKSVETLFTKNHSSTKFVSDGAYNTSSGLNGIGLKAVNALSLKTEVSSYRDGIKAITKFSKGDVSESTKRYRMKEPRADGTTVKFYPDATVLGDFEYNYKDYYDMLENISYISPGLTIKFTYVTKDSAIKTKKFFSKNGIKDYIKTLEKNPMLKKAKYFEADSIVKNKKNIDCNVRVQVSFTYGESDGLNIKSFVNRVRTINGGTHEDYFLQSLTTFIRNYIQKNGAKFSNSNIAISSSDIQDGLTAVILLFHSEPEFDGQTKHEINNKDISEFMREATKKALNEWSEAKGINELDLVCKQIIRFAKARINANNQKVKIKKKTSGLSLNGIAKYSKCRVLDPDRSELWITEGKMSNCPL